MTHQKLNTGITRMLARYAAQFRYEALPERVQKEAARALLNWMGCVLGGCREPAIEIARSVVADIGGSPQSSIIGHAQRTDVANAAFVNCISSSILGFDDAHLATVTHPSSPVCSALFAVSEKHAVSGKEFLAAIALGMEVTCRLSNTLILPPAKFNLGFYVTGLSAPIGVALAVGNLLGLDEEKLNWAICIAATQSGGLRAAQGSMTAHFRPGHASRAGVWAALLAAKGFTGTSSILESSKGFLEVYGNEANFDRATEGLGTEYEFLNNSYKPYPCGIVIHPTLDACLELQSQFGEGVAPARVTLRVNPLALSLCGIKEPATTLESLNSLYHWSAAALVRGRAGVPEMQLDCISDPEIAQLRSRIEVITDASVGSGQAEVKVVLSDGRSLSTHVLHARGSSDRPMTDDDLDAKFRAQARLVLQAPQVDQLRDLCLGAADLLDSGKEISASFL